MRFFVLLFITAALFAESPVTYIYERDMEGNLSQTTWTLIEKKNERRVEGKSRNGHTDILSAPDGNTRTFTYKSKNTYTSIERQNQELIAFREADGSRNQKALWVGNDLWIQEFDFNLKPFILSDSSSLKFYIVHPKKLSLHYMQATKEKFDSMEINGKLKETLKVRITLTGLKKMFWKAELWFDPTNGDLLKYVANEGPNTPVSVITLFSKTKNLPN